MWNPSQIQQLVCMHLEHLRCACLLITQYASSYCVNMDGILLLVELTDLTNHGIVKLGRDRV